MNLNELVIKLRKRLIEYRNYKRAEDASIHINAIDIALSLTDLSLKLEPVRAISKEEEQWFKAGYHLSLIFEESEWSDLCILYCKLVEEVEKRNYFR